MNPDTHPCSLAPMTFTLHPFHRGTERMEQPGLAPYSQYELMSPLPGLKPTTTNLLKERQRRAEVSAPLAPTQHMLGVGHRLLTSHLVGGKA